MARRVLIVDDEKTFADIVDEFLVDDGYSVVRADDGITALNMLAVEQLSPDLILCDVMLPGLTGDRLAADIRQRFPGRPLPIVLLSASSDPQVNLPDVWFMGKPIDLWELLATIEQILAPNTGADGRAATDEQGPAQ